METIEYMEAKNKVALIDNFTIGTETREHVFRGQEH